VTQNNTEIYTSNGAGELESILALLSHDQLRYITARLQTASKSDAAKAIGLKPNTCSHWPAYVERAVILIQQEQITTARHILEHTLVKAMMVKIAGLDSPKEQTRQAVATEIIEWNLGRPRQQTDLAVKLDDTDYTAILLGKLFADDAAGSSSETPGEPNTAGTVTPNP
jgi:hypothetical protein